MRRYLLVLIGLLPVTFGAPWLKAQEPLTLHECVEIALQSNKDIVPHSLVFIAR